MAEKKETPKKIVLERVYNVPLRKGWLKAPKYKRSKKAITTLREFLVKHMKSDNIKIGKRLNEKIWQHGIKNTPHHVKIKAKKDEDGVVKVELEGFDYVEAVKIKKKEEKPTGLKGKLQDAIGKKEEETKEEEKKEEKKPAPKKTAKKASPKKASAKKKPTTKKTSSKK